MSAEILIVDDNADIRNIINELILDAGYKTRIAANYNQALTEIDNKLPDVAILDVRLDKGDNDGIELLSHIKSKNKDVPVIIISGHANIEMAIKSLQKGAFEFIEKPFDQERLLNFVSRAVENFNLKKQNREYESKLFSSYDLIGNSKNTINIIDKIKKISLTESRVCICGPSGTGKELVAHWLHEKSDRSKAPMIEVNCAAIPSELIESELFGHVKGSFTGANKDRAGKFEAATGGTIFLDEIGDMSLSAQAKVLRALQESKISRVGSDRDIKVNVRVVAATNKDLKKEIEAGRFREDLYHRLAVILIKVPALNERREDIPLLVAFFSTKIAKEQGTPLKTFSENALKKLQTYDWTGNIRELRNVVERLIILGENEVSEMDVTLYASK